MSDTVKESEKNLLSATCKTQYGRFARIYDLAANLGSAGAIPAIKRLQLSRINSGDDILYAGVGTGEDALAAALIGARVTVLDISESMLRKCRRRAAGANMIDRMTFVHGDIMHHEPQRLYDLVAANFFLDVFDEDSLAQVIGQLKKLIRPNGKLLVADFAPPNGSILMRAAQRLYHMGASVWCRIIAHQPWLQLKDYTSELRAAGLKVVSVEGIGIVKRGSPWFVTITAEKVVETVNIPVADKQGESDEMSKV